MKLLILLTFLLGVSVNECNKMDLLCYKWVSIGIKDPIHGLHFSKSPTISSLRIWFRKDGTCDQEQNNYGKLIRKGAWKFNRDSSKVSITITSSEFSGETHIDEPSKYFTELDTIIKLTSDTLILGTFFYLLPDSTYVHEDLYYVKEN